MNRQLELGRGGAALPDRQAATGTAPPHARATGPATGDEPWGPATCNVPTADSIILGPFLSNTRIPASARAAAALLQQQISAASLFPVLPLPACLRASVFLPLIFHRPPYSLLTFSPPLRSASRLDLRAGDTDNRHKEFRALAEALHFLHPS